jgi:hypothetical protein
MSAGAASGAGCGRRSGSARGWTAAAAATAGGWSGGWPTGGSPPGWRAARRRSRWCAGRRRPAGRRARATCTRRTPSARRGPPSSHHPAPGRAAGHAWNGRPQPKPARPRRRQRRLRRPRPPRPRISSPRPRPAPESAAGEIITDGTTRPLPGAVTRHPRPEEHRPGARSKDIQWLVSPDEADTLLRTSRAATSAGAEAGDPAVGGTGRGGSTRDLCPPPRSRWRLEWRHHPRRRRSSAGNRRPGPPPPRRPRGRGSHPSCAPRRRSS